MDLQLAGKVAIVTGASRGLGQTFARALARAGADLAITSRTLESLKPFQQEVEARAGLKSALLAHLQARGLVTDSSDVTEVFRGAITLLAETDAEYVMVGLEDTWSETQAQNIPGTAAEQYPNWTNRAAHSLEEFNSVAALTEALETVRRLRGARATAPASQSGIGG